MEAEAAADGGGEKGFVLVEAVLDSDVAGQEGSEQQQQQQQQQHQQQQQQQRRATPGKQQRARRRSRQPRSGSFDYYAGDGDAGSLSAEDATYWRHYATRQATEALEAMFSTDYLITDCYLRSCMDREGWLPLEFALSYPTVAALTCENHFVDLEELVNLLSAGQVVELSHELQLIRLRENWRQWLVPNTEGGYGRAQLYSELRRETYDGADMQQPGGGC